MKAGQGRIDAIGGGRCTMARRVALTLALAFAGAGPALAGGGVAVYKDDAGDSISLFGILDSALATQTKSYSVCGSGASAHACDGGSRTYVQENAMRQSVWGLKGGSGDLGLGQHTTAFFNLESHIDISTGDLHGTGDAAGGAVTPLFRRQANVGMTGDWGTLILGRQYGPALLADLNTEPRVFRENLSSLYQWAYGQLDQTANGGVQNAKNLNNDVGIFFSNSLQYRNTWGPVTLGALYSFRQSSDNGAPNGSAWALGGEYKGPVIVSGSYEQMKDAVTGNTIIDHKSAGFAIPWGDYSFKFLYQNAKHNSAASTETDSVDTYGAGVNWQWNPKNTAILAYYHSRDKDFTNNKTDSIVLSDDWSLNKWITLYAQSAYIHSGSAPGFATSIVAGGPQAPGSEFILNTGVQFSF
jgi:predicted porin